MTASIFVGQLHQKSRRGTERPQRLLLSLTTGLYLSREYTSCNLEIIQQLLHSPPEICLL